MIRIVTCALLGAGCNALIGLDEPTRSDDGGGPACATGWTASAIVDIRNDGPELSDFQVAVRFDGARLIHEYGAAADGHDLRFVDDTGAVLPSVVEGAFDRSDALVWVRTRTLERGATHSLVMYLGNSAAEIGSAPVFVEAIQNASFEVRGAWIADPPRGPAATVLFPIADWASDGAASLYFDHEVPVGPHSWAEASISQQVAFPPGTFRIRFDLDVRAASHGGLNQADDARLEMRLGNGLSSIWSLSGSDGIITGRYFALETTPFGGGVQPLSFVSHVEPGHDAAYARAYLDHVRVRRHAALEPTVIVRAPRLCP